jgi:leucyl aminopeptidase (aminopeptidase T)
MRTANARLEVRVPDRRRTRYLAAAERQGLTLPEWARRQLDEAAEVELAAESEPPPPTADDIAAALMAAGSLKGSGLRERVRKARTTPWTVSR